MSDLYLITPPQFEIKIFKEDIKKALNTGYVSALQLRLKDENEVAPDDDIIKHYAEEIIPICQEYDVSFIINDKPKLAAEIGADGVHIGEDDGSVADARATISDNMVLGVSCYDSLDRAIDAAKYGANYVAFGAFYHTKTKKHIRRPSLDILEFWDRNALIPSVAIGGIKPDNVSPIVKAGADIVAVVTGVWNHPDGVSVAVKQYHDAIS